MIFTFMITSLISLVKTILSVMPTIPATPSAIVTGATWITDMVGTVASVLQMIYSPALMTAIVLIIVAIFGFDTLYHTVMWVLRKIPMINIK